MLARGVEVDEVGDGEGEVEGGVGEWVAPSAAPVGELLDERVPAGAAEREDLLE